MLVVSAIIVAALYFAQDVFIPLALAVLLTFVLSPLADWIERRGIHKSVAAVLVVLVVCGMTLGLAYVVGDQVVQFAQDLPKYKDEIAKKGQTLRGTGGGIEKISATIDDISHAAEKGGKNAATGPATTQSTLGPAANDTQWAGERLGDIGRSLKGQPPAERPGTTNPPIPGTSKANPIFTTSVDDTTGPFGNFAVYAGYVLGPLGTIGLVLVLVLFMLLERDDLRDRFIRLSSGSGRYTVTTQALNDATGRVSRYLRALMIVNGTYGMAIAAGLWIISLTLGHGTTFPSFILWGVLCAVLRFIPYVGPWVAAAFPIAVSLAVYPGFNVFFATVAMFVTIELISNNFMEPILYGSSTGLSTVALLVAAVIWTWLWGAYGLLLSTPLTVCVVVLGRHVPALKFLDVLLGDQPALAPEARFYQRLLADDRKEAAEVVREYANEHGATAAADEVVLAAIRLARQDRVKDELTTDEEAGLYAAASEIVMNERERQRAVEDVADKAADTATDAASEKSVAAGGRREASIGAAASRPLVIGLPAHHRSEQFAIQLLAGLLEPSGAHVDPLACSLLPADVEAQIETLKPAAIFIAVLPPGGMTQARYLCRRLSRRFEHLPIVVGYFGRFRDYDQLLIRLRAAGATHVTTNLAQSRSRLAGILDLKLPPEPSADAKAAATKAETATPAAASTLCSPAS